MPFLTGNPGEHQLIFAGANRPILRGFDGPRVRILESGLDTLDVSETSPDHGVATEPLLTERIEVLRGPATLLYGSSAIGGAVNVIGKEIPRQPVDPKGYEGAVETRYDTVSDGRPISATAPSATEQWALTVTGLDRKLKTTRSRMLHSVMTKRTKRTSTVATHWRTASTTAANTQWVAAGSSRPKTA